jgi:hypothetical protein
MKDSVNKIDAQFEPIDWDGELVTGSAGLKVVVQGEVNMYERILRVGYVRGYSFNVPAMWDENGNSCYIAEGDVNMGRRSITTYENTSLSIKRTPVKPKILMWRDTDIPLTDMLLAVQESKAKWQLICDRLEWDTIDFNYWASDSSAVLSPTNACQLCALLFDRYKIKDCAYCVFVPDCNKNASVYKAFLRHPTQSNAQAIVDELKRAEGDILKSLKGGK